MSTRRDKILVIVGPTGSGKSALAVKLAKRFGGEVISADSRQVYKGLDIGSGKITKKEMAGIPHHLLNVSSPKLAFTVAQYQNLAEAAIQKILRRGKLPIVCGGTGLYVDAVLHGYHFPAVPPDPKLRKKLEKKTAEKLFLMLKGLDPRRAERIDRRNKRRVIRALEIVFKTGEPVPPPPQKPYSDVLKIGIRLPKEKLKRRIYERLSQWLQRGLIKEVEELHAAGLSWRRLEGLGLVYRAVSRYLEKRITKEAVTTELKNELWHYAKRQMTWWKRDKEIHWIRTEAEAIKLIK